MQTMTARKRPRHDDSPEEKKRPNRSGKPISVWVPSDLREAIDTYIDAQRVPPDLTAVVKIAVEDFLQREGFWPPPKASD